MPWGFQCQHFTERGQQTGRGSAFCRNPYNPLILVSYGKPSSSMVRLQEKFDIIWLLLGGKRSSSFTPKFKEYILPVYKVRIGSIIIFHLRKLWKAKFFILCDVIFLVRLQEKFEIDHSLGVRPTIKPTQWSSWAICLLIQQTQTSVEQVRDASPQELFVCNHLFYRQQCNAPYCDWIYIYQLPHYEKLYLISWCVSSPGQTVLPTQANSSYCKLQKENVHRQVAKWYRQVEPTRKKIT